METAVCLSGFVRSRGKRAHKKSFPAKILKTDTSTEKPLFYLYIAQIRLYHRKQNT
jgi:hypothetical protein